MDMSASAVSLHPRRRQGLRQLIHVVALVLVATFLAECSRSLVYRFVGEVGGPLNVNVGTVSGARVKPGTTTTFGIFLHNDTDAVATLDSVRLIELDPGLRIVGLGVTSTEEGGIGTVRGYPPGGRLVEPLRGTPIANTRTHPATILIGVVAARPGRYHVPGIEVSDTA